MKRPLAPLTLVVLAAYFIFGLASRTLVLCTEANGHMAVEDPVHCLNEGIKRSGTTVPAGGAPMLVARLLGDCDDCSDQALGGESSRSVVADLSVPSIGSLLPQLLVAPVFGWPPARRLNRPPPLGETLAHLRTVILLS